MPQAAVAVAGEVAGDRPGPAITEHGALVAADAALSAAIGAMARPVLTNWNGIAVGALRPAGALN